MGFKRRDFIKWGGVSLIGAGLQKPKLFSSGRSEGSLDCILAGHDSPRLYYRVHYREGQGPWRAQAPRSFRLPNANLQNGGRVQVLFISDDHNFDDGDILSTTILVNPPPSIQVDKPSFVFQVQEGRAFPGSQVLKVKNGGGRLLNFEVKAKQSWIKVSPDGGRFWGAWKVNRLNGNTQKYRVYWFDIQGKRQSLAEVKASITNCTFKNAARDKAYSFAITAVDGKNRERNAAFATVGKSLLSKI